VLAHHISRAIQNKKPKRGPHWAPRHIGPYGGICVCVWLGKLRLWKRPLTHFHFQHPLFLNDVLAGRSGVSSGEVMESDTGSPLLRAIGLALKEDNSVVYVNHFNFNSASFSGVFCGVNLCIDFNLAHSSARSSPALEHSLEFCLVCKPNAQF
jgi:hypothetical protein